MSWVTAGQTLNVIVGLASLKVWAVYLVPSELGLMGLIIGLASILSGVVVGPLVQAVFVSFAPHSRKGRTQEFRTITSAILIKRIGIMVILIVIMGVPTAMYLGFHWATPLVVAGLFAIDGRRSYEGILFAAARRQREVAMIATGDASLRLAFVWLFLFMFPPSAYAAIVGNLVGAFVFFLVMRLTFRLEAFPGAPSVTDDLRLPLQKKVLRLSRPLFPSAILANLTEMGNRYLIGAIMGLSTAGLFIISYGLVKRPYGMLNHVTTMTMTPVLSNALASKSLSEIRRSRRLWMGIVAILSAFGILLFHTLREPIVTVLLSKQFSSAGNMLFGLAIAIAIYNVSNVLNGFLITLGNTHAVLISNFVACFATLTLTIALCLLMGVWGAVWALTAGYSLQFITSIWMFHNSSRRAPIAIQKTGTTKV